MNRKFIPVLLVVVAATAALVTGQIFDRSPVLTVVPIRHIPLNEKEEKLVVAITNNTRFTVSGALGQGTNLDGMVAFKIPPHCGDFTWVYGTKRGPWMIAGYYYVERMGDREARLRLWLIGHTPLGGRALSMFGGVTKTPIPRVSMKE